MEIIDNIAELSETRRLDNIIFANRRKMMALAGSAFGALTLTALGVKQASAQTTITDADILNFALNLEYLEAQYYTLATQGKTIDEVGVSIKGGRGGTPGSVTTKAGGPASCQVPFSIPVVMAYANETAQEERNHVTFLSDALGSAAVAMPSIDLFNSFNTLAAAAKIGTMSSTGVYTFDPFASDVDFLLGSYIFEDVGVTAYTGAAGLISLPAYLDAAAGIQAVEAYHAGLIRTTLFGLDAQTPTAGIAAAASAISAVRQSLDNGGAGDVGLGTTTTFVGKQATIVNSDANGLVYSRTTTEVLNIVYAGGVGKGGFFPSGLNGLIT